MRSAAVTGLVVAWGGTAFGMELIVSIPVGQRVVMVVTAGIVEEILFRGYAAARLRELTTWWT